MQGPHSELPIDPPKTLLVACATVIEEMLPILPTGMQHQTLDFGLHLTPKRLKDRLQEAIDQAAPGIEMILLGYGLCSMAVVGLQSTRSSLVVPRVDDCIAIFLGSRDAYRKQAGHEPGTYYLTKGWIEVSDTPLDEYERMIEKYGQTRADELMHLMLKNYTRVAYIDTGQQDQDRYRAYARRMAEQFGLRYEEIVGSNHLVHKMVFGPWDGEFVIAPPNHTLTYADFNPTT